MTSQLAKQKSLLKSLKSGFAVPKDYSRTVQKDIGLIRFWCHSCGVMFESLENRQFFCSSGCTEKGPNPNVIDKFESHFPESLQGFAFSGSLNHEIKPALLQLDDVLNLPYYQKKSSFNRLYKLHQAYVQTQSLPTVQRMARVNSHRLYQMFLEGSYRGWFSYFKNQTYAFNPIGKKSPVIPGKFRTKKLKMEELLLQDISGNQVFDAISQSKTLVNFSKYFNISYKKSLILLDHYKIPHQFIHAKHILDQKQDIIERYNNLVKELGFHPSSTFLVKDKYFCSMASKIIKLWGSHKEFRVDIGIPMRYQNTFRNESTHIRYEYMKRMLHFVEDFGPCSLREIYEFHDVILDQDFKQIIEDKRNKNNYNQMINLHYLRRIAKMSRHLGYFQMVAINKQTFKYKFLKHIESEEKLLDDFSQYEFALKKKPKSRKRSNKN